MAAPAMPAAMIGPLLSLHEKALRLPAPERLVPRFEDVRLDWRLWVRVAIVTSLANWKIQRSGEARRSGVKPPFAAPLDAVRRLLRLFWRGRGLGAVFG